MQTLATELLFKKLCIIFLLCLNISGFISCDLNGKTDRTWSFDEDSFNRMSEAWNNQNLQNYEFEYTISQFIPDSIKGKVTVTDGTGTLILTVDNLLPEDEGYKDSFDFYSSKGKIEFKTINEIYEYIEEIVSERKNDFNNKKLSYYRLNIQYDENNFIPKLINEELTFQLYILCFQLLKNQPEIIFLQQLNNILKNIYNYLI